MKKNIQRRIRKWQLKTFGESQSVLGLLNHLKKEIIEFEKWGAWDELADCQILLYGIAAQCGFDLLRETEKKFAIIQQRKWQKPDADGIIEHVRDCENEDFMKCPFCGHNWMADPMKKGKTCCAEMGNPAAFFLAQARISELVSNENAHNTAMKDLATACNRKIETLQKINKRMQDAIMLALAWSDSTQSEEPIPPWAYEDLEKAINCGYFICKKCHKNWETGESNDIPHDGYLDTWDCMHEHGGCGGVDTVVWELAVCNEPI